MPAICRQRFAVRAKKFVEKNFLKKNIWSVRRKIVPLHPQRGQRDACSMHDSVAQLVEQLTLNQRVEGSSPSGNTNYVAKRLIFSRFAFFIVNRLSTKIYFMP